MVNKKQDNVDREKRREQRVMEKEAALSCHAAEQLTAARIEQHARTMMAEPETPPTVVSVVEAAQEASCRPQDRIFTVILSAATGNLGIAAAASDPVTGVAIPATDEPHPNHPDWIAREPIVFAVGMKMNGVLLATRSKMYNVRVKYKKR